MQASIQVMTEADWPRVRAIYQDGIDSGNATFETVALDFAAWDRSHLPEGRLVAVSPAGPPGEAQVAGFAVLSLVSGRCIYRGVAEVSVYVEPASHGRGIGKALLQALVDASEQAGFWTLTAGVFPENAASLALHLACGFRVVGTRERVGCLHGVWRDVVLLERRSQRVGV
jgi:phosphinothricin acetyltransferase